MAGTLTLPTAGKVDIPLSNFAREYRNPAYVGDRVLPRVGVMKQSDLYTLWGTENMRDPGDERRAATAAAIEIVQSLSDDKYFADDHALSRLVALEEISGLQQRGKDPRQWAAQALTDILLLKKEIRTKDLVTAAAEYGANNKVTLAGTSKWSDLNNSDPIKDVEKAKKQVRLVVEPNLMLINPDTFEQLAQHPKIKERFINVTGGPVTLRELSAVFGLEVLLASAVVRSTADVPSFIWPDTAWVGYATPAATQQDPSFGKSFLWETAPDTAEGFGVEENEVFPKSRKSLSIDVHFYYDLRVTAKDSGYIIIDTV